MPKKIGLCRLSDPLNPSRLETCFQRFLALGYTVECSPYLYEDVSGKKRASHINEWFKGDFDFIFDVSGGDLSVECLPYLDFEAYQQNKCIFAGYSDLTPVLNALGAYRKTLLFQVRHTSRWDECVAWMETGNHSLFYSSDVFVGGNVRCLLKTAGTPYFPDFHQKHLFLESYGGDVYRIRSYFAQLELMGVFDQIQDLTLGQFTELDQKGHRNWLTSWSQAQSFDVYMTSEVGHDPTSKALWIGQDFDTLYREV